MKKVVMGILLGLSGLTLMAGPAAAETEKQKEHQKIFGECAQEGKGLKGDEFKKHQKECVAAKKGTAGHHTATGAVDATTHKADKKAAKAAQQEKMKTCNADAKAKSLKGKDRKAFMKDCLSSHGV